MRYKAWSFGNGLSEPNFRIDAADGTWTAGAFDGISFAQFDLGNIEDNWEHRLLRYGRGRKYTSRAAAKFQESRLPLMSSVVERDA